MEQNELNKFYQSLQVDIRSDQLSGEEGGTLEQLFTQAAVDILVEADETADVRVVFHESVRPRHRYKINAYALTDDYETLELFVTIFRSTEEISRLQKSEILHAAALVTRFFIKAREAGFSDELEESSEVFDLARTIELSADLRENLARLRITVITDGIYSGEILQKEVIDGIPVFYKIADITWLYNLSEKSHAPIEIDFLSEGYRIPCIAAPSANGKYQSYLAIVPAKALADIYERHGARLLEQNVRSFLQFTGKINKGIRNTINNEPHMFLAYNNGLAATAASLEIVDTAEGAYIGMIKDLQIVNGGQTTASLYYSWRKKPDSIRDVYVQMKLSIIPENENFSEIVSRISEYANTQNKVSASDLSSNKPFHIRLEKISRDTWAPAADGRPAQTRWFFERSRGQYKSIRQKEGSKIGDLRNFDRRNPKNQVFRKEDLAKYVNSFREVYDQDKLVVGPHVVVRGNQKNYAAFIRYNAAPDPDITYFEEVVAKALLFRSAERIYGISPSAIGDMRYITVPYSIAWLSCKTENRLDLYKIWRAQVVSSIILAFLYKLMVQVEKFIKKNAPGSLYGEWAKKEECWAEVKCQTFDLDMIEISNIT
jgi:hypothetical protein